MRRAVQILNALGVLALVAMCCLQWIANRRLNLQASALEQTRLNQLSKISEQDKKIAEQLADLDDFRQRLILSDAALKESHEKFHVLEMEHSKVLAERDELKSALEKWQAAVTERDAGLKQAGEEIQKLIAERDDAIEKFNDVAKKYNGLVTQQHGQNKK